MTSPNPLTVAVEALERLAHHFETGWASDCEGRGAVIGRAEQIAREALSQIASLSGGEEEQGSSRDHASSASSALDTRYWEVEVRISGETVLTIGHEHVAGLSDLEPYADRIRSCADHLRAFIGSGEPRPCFLCGGVDKCADDCPLQCNAPVDAVPGMNPESGRPAEGEPSNLQNLQSAPADQKEEGR